MMGIVGGAVERRDEGMIGCCGGVVGVNGGLMGIGSDGGVGGVKIIVVGSVVVDLLLLMMVL